MRSILPNQAPLFHVKPRKDRRRVDERLATGPPIRSDSAIEVLGARVLVGVLFHVKHSTQVCRGRGDTPGRLKLLGAATV
jgi:hypothetical protein